MRSRRRGRAGGPRTAPRAGGSGTSGRAGTRGATTTTAGRGRPASAGSGRLATTMAPGSGRGDRRRSGGRTGRRRRRRSGGRRRSGRTTRTGGVKATSGPSEAEEQEVTGRRITTTSPTTLMSEGPLADRDPRLTTTMASPEQRTAPRSGIQAQGGPPICTPIGVHETRRVPRRDGTHPAQLEKKSGELQLVWEWTHTQHAPPRRCLRYGIEDRTEEGRRRLSFRRRWPREPTLFGTPAGQKAAPRGGVEVATPLRTGAVNTKQDKGSLGRARGKARVGRAIPEAREASAPESQDV
mmetsp:Transcript_122700/g.281297  ORF Transcript_122700/g.281297 Transcript_122700/m.281297 type:complete len:296 (+) Transcript_122700:2053-2940(+)